MSPLPQHKPASKALGLGTTQGNLGWGSLRASLPRTPSHPRCPGPGLFASKPGQPAGFSQA